MHGYCPIKLPCTCIESAVCLWLLKCTRSLCMGQKCKAAPIRGLDKPRGFQEVKVPRFRDNGTAWW